MSYMRGDLLSKTRKLVKGLAKSEPVWLKAMEKVPPAAFPRAENKIKPISLPEDVYISKFFQKHPDSKHEDPIKIRYKTSVLSKRYRLLWTSLPCLDFKFFGHFIDRFSLFVNHVLARREPSNLSMFRLSLKKAVGSAFLDNCISYAAKHKVEHLRIRAYTNDSPSTLPRWLLNSSWLRILRLNNVTCYSMLLPKSLALPGLKVLWLKNFVFSDENYNGELFSGCPSLETLILNKCCIRPEDKLKVLD
ncbi:F-box domain-containing protein [Forsythia ovata]|uniref:Small ribosomal subunit protein mS23 n=1 Tax=Forsythia ovata TaxID=205694 RepID=A0ABD1U589_9LAMI